MKKFFPILLSIIIAGIICPYCIPQEKEVVESKEARLYKESYHSALDEIGNGISSGNISAIYNLFSSQIYLSLTNGVSGYYSSNQAYYVIQDFLKTHQVVSLDINDIQEDEENVYATGAYSYLVKGKKESSLIYICLKRSNKKWKITQITIN